MNNQLKRKLSAMAAALMLATAGTGILAANAETLTEDPTIPAAQEEVLQEQGVNEDILLVDELIEEIEDVDLQVELEEVEIKTNIRDNTLTVIAKLSVNGNVIDVQISLKNAKAEAVSYKSTWNGGIWDSTLLLPVAEGVEVAIHADCNGLDEDVLDIVQNSTAVVELVFEIVNAFIAAA